MSTNPSASAKKHLIIRNAFFTLSRGGLGLFLTLIITPMYLGYLGIEGYGRWVLITILATNLASVDFGLAAGMTRFIAFYSGRKEPDSINRCLNSGIFLYVLFGLFYVISFTLFHETVSAFLLEKSNLSTRIPFSMAGTFLFFFVNFIGSSLSASLDGLQRIEINQKISFFVQITVTILSLALLREGWGINSLIIAGVVGGVLGGILRCRSLLLQNPDIRISLHDLSWSGIIELLNFGLFFQISNLAGFVHSNIDKIFLRHYVGTEFVGIYELMTKLPLLIRRLSEMLQAPFIPAFAEIHASEETELLQSIFNGAVKIVVISSFPAFLFLTFFGEQILFVWLGKWYVQFAFVLPLFSLAHCVNLTTGPGFNLLNSMGQPKYGMFSSLLATVLNVVFCWILVRQMGFAGAVIGTSLAMTIAALFFHVLFYRATRITTGRILFREIGPPLLCSSILLIIFGSLFRNCQLSSPGLSLLLVVYSLILSMILYRWQYFSFRCFDGITGNAFGSSS